MSALKYVVQDFEYFYESYGMQTRGLCVANDDGLGSCHGRSEDNVSQLFHEARYSHNFYTTKDPHIIHNF